MRIWSIHPVYLDSKGLVALWREGLLAQNVLLGKTKGYKNHPQLIRFKNSDNPVGAIAEYLRFVIDEANKRGYNFNDNKIAKQKFNNQLKVTSGQVEYEFQHLLNKLKTRNPELYKNFKKVKNVKTHPLFNTVNGNVENWEII